MARVAPAKSAGWLAEEFFADRAKGILPINNVQITMTLTAPSSPAAQSLPVEVDQKVREIDGVNDVHVAVTWDPPWDKSMMSEAAQLELGWL